MTIVDRKSGLIDTEKGWTIDMPYGCLKVFNENESYELSCEIVDGGMKVVIFDDLVNTGVDAEKAAVILSITRQSLADIGMEVEVD